MSKVKLSQNAEKVFRSRYALTDTETWDDCVIRVASFVSSNEIRRSFVDNFAEIMYEMLFIPGGRILRNAGRSRGSLLNCFVLPCKDSIESIGQFFKDALILWSEGGGVGVNFSFLRPKGDPVISKGGKSSGLVSFIEASDAIAKTVQSGGGRRAASLFCVDVSHPEVLDFIDAKLTDGRLPHCNISVAINNEFLETVEADSLWQFKFQQKKYGEIPAREIWHKIVSNMLSSAEPGLLNTTNLYQNNSWYFAPISSTNPCGEACLEDYGACDLGSLVLPKFVSDQGRTNWKLLESTINTAVRFLDNVLDINKYAITEVAEACRLSRRIGLGFMGLADYLFAKKLRYGSKEALNEIERLIRFIRDSAYIASISIAKEKGSFPMFDSLRYSKSTFVRKLPAFIRKDIKQYGIRNVTLLSIAPTGTISLIPEVSSGCEPLFSKFVVREDRIGKRFYIHPIYRNIIKEAIDSNKRVEVPDWFVDTFDLDPTSHLATQAGLQAYVDGAVSKTINVPQNTTEEQLNDWLLEFVYDLKGVTVYRDGTRKGQILRQGSLDEAIEYVQLNKSDEDKDSEVPIQQCSSGICGV